tara:strand:- start:167 stop:433 length:267 start_codon:yes stop_codon:yes gene_type:complete
MIKVNHIAIWTRNLEVMKNFYQFYFNASASEKYVNSKTKFESYFLSFEGSDMRLELVYQPDLKNKCPYPSFGYVHIAFSLGSKQKVDH